MAWATRSYKLRKTPLSFEAMGVLHTHPDADVRFPNVEWNEQRTIETDYIHVVGGTEQLSNCTGPLDDYDQHDCNFNRRFCLRDSSRCLPVLASPVAGHRGDLHNRVHSRVLLPSRRVWPGWHLTCPIRDYTNELLRPDSGAALLRRGVVALDRVYKYVSTSSAPCDTASPLGQSLETRPLCIWDETRGRGAKKFVSRNLRPSVSPLHGRCVLFERPLSRRETELPGSGADDNRPVARIQHRLRPWPSPWGVAEVWSLLHRGINSPRLPEYRSGQLVGSGHYDFCGLRRGVSENDTWKMCWRYCDARWHVAYSTSRCYRRAKVPGRIRVQGYGRGQAPRSDQDASSRPNVVFGATERHPSETKESQNQGSNIGTFDCCIGLCIGRSVGAARTINPRVETSVR